MSVQKVRPDDGNREGKWVALTIAVILGSAAILMPYHQVATEKPDIQAHQVLITDLHQNELGLIAELGPLLGLLGTVNGMLHLFADVANLGLSDPKQISSGISEALVATFTFWIASIDGTYDCAARLHGFSALTPSMRTVAPLLPVPLKAKVMPFEGLLVPPLNCPPGGVVPVIRTIMPR